VQINVQFTQRVNLKPIYNSSGKCCACPALLCIAEC